jgi:hypothetical protein
LDTQNLLLQKNYPGIVVAIMLLIVSTSSSLYGQKAGVKGTITDSTGKSFLNYAVIALINKKDSTLTTSSRSKAEGKFLLDKIVPGNYTVLVTYPDMADFLVDISLGDTGITDIGKIVMNSRYHLLQEVIVRSGKAIRMKGDTLEFKADSFYLPAGANVEELLRRLPGIEVGPDGKIKAQGKEVTSVLVDGDEFFNDDPTLVTQYLKSASVDKVQVYDSKSAQTQLTGIDDGVRNKTMNIKLKENSKNGMFGKASVGTDANGFYSHEGMLNVFRGKEKISVFGVTSNTGATGISFQDRSQYFGTSYDGIEDETGRLIGNSLDISDRYFGGGLPSSISGAAQYANKWNENKQGTNINYRFSQIQTQGWQTSNGTQVLPDNSIRQSSSRSSSASYTQQHKAGGYYDTRIDSFFTLKVFIDAQTQRSNSLSNSYSESKNGKGDFLNKSDQLNSSDGNRGVFNSSFQLQKRFRKIGRLASFTFIQNHNNAASTRLSETLSFYYTGSNTNPQGDSVNQMQFNKSLTNSIATRITYTEPLSEHFYLSTEYSWRQTGNNRDRNVFGRGMGGKYDTPVDSLSNHYTFNIQSHTPGMTLQYSSQKVTLTTGGRISYTELEQVNRDLNMSTRRSFINLFPQARMEYKISQQKRMSFSYNGRTDQPSIEQLQPLRDNSNPLFVNIGNPNLRPSFYNSASINFSSFKMTGRSISVNINWGQTFNSIISKQTVDQFNKSTSQYINRNGLPNFNIYFNYSRPISKPSEKGSGNISFNIGVNRNGYLRILNDNEIITRQNAVFIGTNLSYYKNKIFNVNYYANLSYSISEASIGNIGSNFMVSHNHNARATVYLPWKIELTSDVNMSFQPANGSFNNSRNIIKWNASVLKKLMKNSQAQIKLSVFDILNQNTGYNRSVSGNSFYESASNYIPRYGILSFIWNFTTTL